MTDRPPFLPFFMPAPAGERFCVFHPPAGEARGAFVYVHPFAEEMNKSRRMAAMQSRRFAEAGYAVLQIDLLGCGDSSGELGDASWDAWNADVARAVQWLKARVDAPVHLWGLRLGALLALDHGRDAGGIDGYVLWQPPLSGAALVTQFLRLRIAAGLTDGGRRVTTQDLRSRLADGETLEIAGYDLTPVLADAIDRLKLGDLAPASGEVRWLEVVPDGTKFLPAAAQRVADAWSARGLDLETRVVGGPQFWSAIEIVDNPQLIEMTLDACAGVSA